MRHIFGPLAAGVSLLAIATSAHGQQNPTATVRRWQGYDLQRELAQPSRPVAPTARPLFYLFGIPVVLNARVVPPYCNCAYENYAGQPAAGRNSPLVYPPG